MPLGDSKTFAQIAKARDFSRAQDYDAFAIVRVHNSLLASLGGRNAWVKIVGPTRTLVRRARGAGGTTGLPIAGIELDYDSRLELNIVGSPPDAQGFYPCELQLSKASAWNKFIAHWAHPNLEYRIPYQIAMVSAALGAVGLILGIVSLIK